MRRRVADAGASVPPTLAFDASGTPFSPTVRRRLSQRATPAPGRRATFSFTATICRRAGRARARSRSSRPDSASASISWRPGPPWRDDPERCARLHFVSIERYPFRRGDLAALHARHPQLAALPSQLLPRGRPRCPACIGCTSRHDQVTLTLVLDDVDRRRRATCASAPTRSISTVSRPTAIRACGRHRCMKALARLAASGRNSRDLHAARAACAMRSAPPDLPVERRAGFGRKRRHARRALCAALAGAAAPGSAVAGRSAMRSSSGPGWRARRWPRASPRAAGASISSNAAAQLRAPRPALRAGVFQPHVSLDDESAFAFHPRRLPVRPSGMVRSTRCCRDATVAALRRAATGRRRRERGAGRRYRRGSRASGRLCVACDARRCFLARRPTRRTGRLVVSDGGIRASGGDRRGATRPRFAPCRRRTGAGHASRSPCRKAAA